MNQKKVFLIWIMDLLPHPLARGVRRIVALLRRTQALLQRRDPGALLVIPGVSYVIRRFASRGGHLSLPYAETSPHESETSHARAVCVTYSSRGNQFFLPIAESLAEAFSRAGFEAEMAADEINPETIPIIVAPHEFFTLTDSQTRGQVRLKEAILLNTEQPHTRWFGLAWQYMREAGAVLDLSQDSARFSSSFGVPASFIPLKPRKSEDWRRASILETELTSTRAFGREMGSWIDRPIDVLFVGTLSRRREAVLASLAPILAGFKTSIRLAEARQPLTSDSAALTTTSEFAWLARRSKIILNIHRDRHRYFEWQRLVMFGMEHGCLVVTEATPDPGVFHASQHYVEGQLQDLPRLLTNYLTDQAHMSLAEQTVRMASQRLETLDTTLIVRDVMHLVRHAE